jgi:hypothetical protein
MSGDELGSIRGGTMSDIQKERDQNSKAFQKELPKLKALRGKYFLMKGGKIINFYDTLEDAYSTGTTFYDDRMFSVFALKARSRPRGESRRGNGYPRKSLGPEGPRVRRIGWRADRARPTFPAMTRTTRTRDLRSSRTPRTPCASSRFIMAPTPGRSSVWRQL